MAGDLIPPHTYNSGDLLTAVSLNEFLLEAKIKDGAIIYSHFSESTLEKLEDFFNKRRYKVGDLIITKNDENPSKIYGGTWELLKDKFLVGAGGEFAVGDEGGEKEHTLTTNEMPTHSHVAQVRLQHSINGGGKNNGIMTSDVRGGEFKATNEDGIPWVKFDDAGGSKAHNNMPPYYAVNIWIKTSDENDTQ